MSDSEDIFTDDEIGEIMNLPESEGVKNEIPSWVSRNEDIKAKETTSRVCAQDSLEIILREMPTDLSAEAITAAKIASNIAFAASLSMSRKNSGKVSEKEVNFLRTKIDAAIDISAHAISEMIEDK